MRMAPKLNLPVSFGIVLAIIAVGLFGMIQAEMMTTDTTLTMVLPSMVIFAVIVFALGVFHGEYRASN